MATQQEIEAGQAVYTPFTLKLYDWFVLGFSNRFLWRCPTSNLRDQYQRNVGRRHLDIGVGTGYFLDHVRWPTQTPQITLVDLNPHSLDAAAARIARYAPRSQTANCLEPMDLEGPFDSVALGYLLHCLPGTIERKSVVFDHAAAVMDEGAVLFGATILQGDAPRSWPAQALMNLYNRKGVFSNDQDSFQALEAALKARFTKVDLTRIGAVALFEARL